MMKLLLLTLMLSVSFNTQADIAVITNLNNDLPSLDKQAVEEIFMGRTRTFSNGTMALPLDLEPSRTDFYTKLTNRPIEQINAYWARIMFSGIASPPMKMLNEAEVIKTIVENKGAIGYVDIQ